MTWPIRSHIHSTHALARSGRSPRRGTSGLPPFTTTAGHVHSISARAALLEGSRPHDLDPLSLATIGESTLGGLLGSGPTDSFAPHPRHTRMALGSGGALPDSGAPSSAAWLTQPQLGALLASEVLRLMGGLPVRGDQRDG